MSNKLQELMQRCKASVSVELNPNRAYHQTAFAFLKERREFGLISKEELDGKIEAEMVAKNTIVCIQLYPDTSIRFIRVWHYDLEAALDEALSIMNEKHPIMQEESTNADR